MPKYIAQVIAGKIINGEGLRAIIAKLRDGHYQVNLTAKRDRSLSQNAYFHGVVLPIVLEGLRDAGFDDVVDEEDAKSVVKNLFAKKWLHNPDGLAVEYIQPTHRMTTIEFSEFIEKIIKFGAEYLNVQIPYPNEHVKNWGQ